MVSHPILHNITIYICTISTISTSYFYYSLQHVFLFRVNLFYPLSPFFPKEITGTVLSIKQDNFPQKQVIVGGWIKRKYKKSRIDHKFTIVQPPIRHCNRYNFTWQIFLQYVQHESFLGNVYETHCITLQGTQFHE